MEYRVDDWRNGKTRVLFIVGLAGSGKTTTASEMAKGDSDLTAVHTDEVDVSFRKGRESLDTGTYCKTLINHIMHTYKGRLIIEGVHALAADREVISENSLLIIDTSMTVSNFRAFNRSIVSGEISHVPIILRDNIKYSRHITHLKHQMAMYNMKKEEI